MKKYTVGEWLVDLETGEILIFVAQVDSGVILARRHGSEETTTVDQRRVRRFGEGA
jgi:hypothetical protein